VMAIGAFAAAEWSEKKFAHRNPEKNLWKSFSQIYQQIKN
jgi:hypothetical protein